jgi:hypothetical protein
MATKDNYLSLYYPFDEEPGTAKAHDFSKNRADATVTNASFKQGRSGYCIHFDGTGKAEVDAANVIDLKSEFTLLAYIKPTVYGDDDSQTKRIGFLFNFECDEGEYDTAEKWIDVTPGTWGLVALRQFRVDADLFNIGIYIDGQLKDTVAVSSYLSGFAILQDVYSTDLAVADLDDVRIYNKALSESEISEDTANRLAYYIDGVNLADLGIRISSSSGVLDLPKMKTPTTLEWSDYHGEVVDLSDKRFEARDITLNCWMKAAGKLDFITKANQLQALFAGDGTNRLMIAISPIKPLVYEVYNSEGISFDKKWHDDKMIGTFTLKLREPDPVKRVLRWQQSSTNPADVSVAFKSDRMINIYWGDGTADYDLAGDYTSSPITHTYEKDGIYYPIVAGIIDDIKDFDTNAIIIWAKI